MIKMIEIIGDKQSKAVVVRFGNKPTAAAPRFIVESKFISEAGQEKTWGKGFTYRLDRRGEHHGGDQLHIYGPKNQSWAYRFNGTKSEPNKYTSPATNIVKDIVRDVFSLHGDAVVESNVVEANADEIVVEVTFA